MRAEVARLEAQVEELDALAYEDPLLKIPNRRSFLRDLEHVLADVERYGGEAAMIFVDVDGLKRINDKFGHLAGDAALIHIAETLVATVRKSDRVGRLAGDEFGILLPHSNELCAWQMALRVVEAVIGSDFALDGTPVSLSVAVGVAQIEAGDSAGSIVERADTAMYRIKAA